MKPFVALMLFFACNVHADIKSDSRAIEHAPIGVSADHFHKKGESMISVRHGHMKMGGTIFNGNDISFNDVLAMPNPLGNMPSNLSVIPTDMTMQMSMVGGMYAPTDSVTLMMMGMFVSKDMNLNTYQAMMNRDLLGDFNTSSSDISDFSMGALIKLKETGISRLHAEISLQHSIGSRNTKGVVLTPMGKNMNMTLPYGMQSGDGATRVILGMTHVKKLSNKMRWGNQARIKIAVSKDHWAFGDHTEVNSWLQYEVNQAVSLSSRLKWTHQSKISGRDPTISAPVQTASPENYGGREWHIGFGINLLTQLFPGNRDRFGLELMMPVEQQKNNLQMKTDYQVIFGYQKTF
tara:strand:- start:144 stop:1190 length:1047 start_codon:yes stop_codon:yes gene_type:complete